MPFNQLQSAQQLEVVVAGPADANRLYICAGLANGNYQMTVPANTGDSSDDTWQFEVGPKLAVNQFRGSVATASLAGIVEQGQLQWISWSVQGVTADFDGQTGMVRMSATNALNATNSAASSFAFAGIAVISYHVSILAAMPAGA